MRAQGAGGIGRSRALGDVGWCEGPVAAVRTSATAEERRREGPGSDAVEGRGAPKKGDGGVGASEHGGMGTPVLRDVAMHRGRVRRC